jgi:tetratricopeptide (TPR) repeat protein
MIFGRKPRIRFGPRPSAVTEAIARVGEYLAKKALGESTNRILDQAVEDFNEAVRLDPASKRNANALGRAYLLQRSYDFAIENFEKVIKRDETYASAYSGLCFAYRMRGQRGDMDRGTARLMYVVSHGTKLKERKINMKGFALALPRGLEPLFSP